MEVRGDGQRIVGDYEWRWFMSKWTVLELVADLPVVKEKKR